MELVITLLVVGIILILLETILPGLIAGTIGVMCLIAGVMLAYSRFGTQTGTMILLGVVVGCTALVVVWIKYFPESPMARPFILKRAIGDIHAEKPGLLNQTGTAFTPLRPSGTALINGQRIDVVTEGPMIEKGTPVKVVQIEGMRVVVRALNSGETSSS